MSRERLIRSAKRLAQAGVLASYLGTAACSHAETPAQPDIDSPQGIYLLYPFLDRTKPNSIDRLVFSSNIPTVVANFTDFEINQRAIGEIYRVIDSFSIVPLTTSDGDLTITPQLSKLTSRTSVIVPEAAQNPCSHPFACTQYRGSTANSYIRAIEITVRKDLFILNSKLEVGTDGFAIEACQQSIRAERVYDNKIKSFIEDKDSLFAGQEVLCNSIGLAIAARLVNIPYDSYEEFARSALSGSANRLTNLILFPEDFYSSIAPMGTVIQE